jgi:hypothetical protein
MVRCGALVQVFTHGLMSGSWWLLALWALSTLLLTLCLGWDGEVVVLCGVRGQPPVHPATRESLTGGLLSELYCWGWVVVSVGFCLPRVLLPLTGRDPVGPALRLRLSPISRRELALARLTRPLLAVLLLGALSVSWALICSAYHALPVRHLLLLAGGLLTHLFLSATLVLAGAWTRTEWARTAWAVLALLVPPLADLLSLALAPAPGVGWWSWWPLTTPVGYRVVEDGSHLVGSWCIGLLLAGVYVFSQRGVLIGPPTSALAGGKG